MSSVKELVETAINDNKIVVFSKSWCPYCKRAKNTLKAEGPKVYELDELDDGSDIQAYLLEKTGQRTVPNIFIGKQHIGGADDLSRLEKTGELAKLLA